LFFDVQKPVLLDDAAMQRFIAEGCVTLQSDLPRDYHARMFAALDELQEGGPLGHNNLLPCVPELAQLLHEPKVRGALASVLGASYYLHFHRHDHFQFPGAAQPLHKDGDNHSHYAVDGLRRMHRTRFAMLFYYPQDTPLEKGPTGIVPRSQYLPRYRLEAARRKVYEAHRRCRQEVEAEFGKRIHASEEAQRALQRRLARFRNDHPALFQAVEKLEEPWEAAKVPLVGEAGTFSVVHFDLVHGRYGANATNLPRHMVKFIFVRDREPCQPSWRHLGQPWPEMDDAMSPVWRSMWAWHGGAPSNAPRPFRVADLDGEDEQAALAAAYTCGTVATAETMQLLRDRFLGDEVATRTIAAYGLVASGRAAVPWLVAKLHEADADLAVRIVDVLGDIGPGAVDALPCISAAVEHDDVNVRRYAVEALGTVAQGQRVDSRHLATALTDEDALVRRNAALATARLAADLGDGDALVAPLCENLHHWHHHVRGWAVEALQRLQSPKATQAALRYLATARWDATPKSGDVPPGAKPPRTVVGQVSVSA